MKEELLKLAEIEDALAKYFIKNGFGPHTELGIDAQNRAAALRALAKEK